MKCFATLIQFCFPVPGKLVKIQDQEVEILPGAVSIPALSLIVPFSNVKFIKTGKKSEAKPAPTPKKSEKAEAPRAEGKKSEAKKPAKPKTTVRTSKKVRGEQSS